MRRFLIFGVLGPILGFLIAIATAIGLGVRPSDAEVVFVMFAYAFAAGIVPAVLAGAVDWHLALARRVLATLYVCWQAC